MFRAEVWVLRLEVEILGLRLGFLRCELEVEVLRFEVEVWGLWLGVENRANEIPSP